MRKAIEFVKTYWQARTKKQKIASISSVVIGLLLIVGLVYFTTNKNYVPLYNNLSVQEVSQIKEELDTQGIPYQIEENGTAISVPSADVESLLVELAGQGIPNSGSIDYSFFSENASWGITDNEFNIMKLDAMQTELGNLMKGIDGIEDARVMINMPEDTIFVNESLDEASASIVLHTKLGYEFEEGQINSLYHLVAKAVPNLPEENIVIMNQYFEYYDKSLSNTATGMEDYTYHQTVKKDIEKDIQRRVQQMLGSMVGMDSVIVSVTADVDFAQENRIEELVDPVDIENMEGIPVSIETVQETYSGNQVVGGVPGTGEEDIPGYEANVADGDGDYELVKETINNELNHIRKDIVESPYKIRDLGIQVAINSVVSSDGDEVQLLSQQDQLTVEEGIESILNSIITTSIDKGYGEITPEDKTSIVFQEFTGREDMPGELASQIPLWLYIIGAILLLGIVILLVVIFRRRRVEEVYEEETLIAEETPTVPDLDAGPETEEEIRKQQLEKMAQNSPEDFAKLLRSWMSED